jgi:quercetin dioxygenase-like cupin family protein
MTGAVEPREDNMRAALYITALCSAGLVLLAAGFVLGQHVVPTDYHLVSEEVLASIDLAKEIDSVQNRELRLSRAVVLPGGHIGLHSHKGDPTIVYLLSGLLTNHHDDGTMEEFGPGQAFAEFGPRAHWVENKGAIPVTFIVANTHRRE